MSLAAPNIIAQPTDEVEEETFARMYPWRCYRHNNNYVQEFKTLEEMCDVMKVSAEAVRDAVRSRKGKMGSYVFEMR